MVAWWSCGGHVAVVLWLSGGVAMVWCRRSCVRQ